MVDSRLTEPFRLGTLMVVGRLVILSLVKEPALRTGLTGVLAGDRDRQYRLDPGRQKV